MTEGIPHVNHDVLYSERAFLRRLESLPSELADPWRNEYEQYDNPPVNFYERFQAFFASRERVLDGSLLVQEGVNEEIRKEIEQVKKVIREVFGDPLHFLGNGFTAEVYELPIAPHLCVKYIHDQEAYNLNNHLRIEYAFLEELREFRHAMVRTPLPYFLRIHPSEGHAYGMERIPGKNLSQILERPADNLDLIAVIKNLDREQVKKNLLAYITELHKKFNITHGDLFRRNIMVDPEGNFYVIDFGKAKHEQIGEDHEERRKTDIATLTSEIGLFFKAIDKLEIV
jgi:tRNA A-37 threonylcarbamoyl transferase component Bud32